MDEVLQKLNLDHFIENFKEQKISPDIECKLSSQDLEILGITIHEQTRCYVARNCVFDKTKFTLSCPEIFHPKSVLQSWLDEDFTIAEIAKLLCVSESTVYRRMREYNLSKLAFTDISDQELDNKVNIKMFKIKKASFKSLFEDFAF